MSDPDFRTRVSDIMTRLHLDEQGAADYLGVPVYTLRKWTTGQRTPNASVLRLVEVLGLIEAMTPDMHACLLPAKSIPRKRGRPKKQIDNPVMSENPV